MHHDQLPQITYCGLGTIHDFSSSCSLDQGMKPSFCPSFLCSFSVMVFCLDFETDDLSSLLFQGVYFMHYGNNETLVTLSFCNDYNKQWAKIFTIYQLVVCFALPALVMIVAYSIVIRVLWKSNRNMSMLTNATR